MGVPGAGYGTFGSGATNLSAGVGGAWLDRSPLVHCVCFWATANAGYLRFMVSDTLTTLNLS